MIEDSKYFVDANRRLIYWQPAYDKIMNAEVLIKLD